MVGITVGSKKVSVLSIEIPSVLSGRMRHEQIDFGFDFKSIFKIPEKGDIRTLVHSNGGANWREHTTGVTFMATTCVTAALHCDGDAPTSMIIVRLVRAQVIGSSAPATLPLCVCFQTCQICVYVRHRHRVLSAIGSARGVR